MIKSGTVVASPHTRIEFQLTSADTDNPAEFFAVVTEEFFERPRQLRSRHPELYAQLQQFYLQDPGALDRR